MPVSPHTIPHHAEIELVQGSSLALRVRVLDGDGAAKSLFNGAASWTLRQGNFASFGSGAPVLEQDTDGAGSAGVTVAIVEEAPYWYIELEVAQAATLALATGSYIDEFWATDANGMTWPVLRGTLCVLKRVASAA